MRLVQSREAGNRRAFSNEAGQSSRQLSVAGVPPVATGSGGNPVSIRGGISASSVQLLLHDLRRFPGNGVLAS